MTYLSKSQLCNNLTGLPSGLIKGIRELKLNKRRVRIGHWKTKSINHANLRNLKQVNTTNEVKHQQTKKLWFVTINTRSIKQKEDIICGALNEYKINLLVTTETWLKDTQGDQQWLQGSELNRSGFQTLPINRETGKGGGIALTIKNITVKQQDTTEYNSFKHAVWNINHKDMPAFTVVAIYHPPSSCQNSMDSIFIDQLTDLLTSIQTKHSNTIILRGINIHMDDHSNQYA